MNELLALTALLIAGSLIVTKTVDLLRTATKSWTAAWPSATWIVLAFIVGIAYAVGFHVDYSGAALKLVPALATAHVSLFVGELLTGLALGAWADFGHKVLANLSAGTAIKTARAAALK